ncbi:MAG TPA: polyamine ABC transporter substrate-binding protein [Steroidobacteraceae bacterium]|nr:polyamine ABC transporter substrate-binding protein [Steroidobacteraceae bacterium]
MRLWLALMAALCLQGCGHSRSDAGSGSPGGPASGGSTPGGSASASARRQADAAGAGRAARAAGAARDGDSGAQEERVLHIYNWDDYVGFHTIEDFERATGIQVVYDLYDSNETLESKLLVGDSGYDIVSTTTGFYGRQIRSGLYEPLDKSQLPNWQYLDPHVLEVQAQADPGNRYAAPYLHAMNGFAYNVDAVRSRMPDAPLDSLDMLFKPEVVAHFADCGISFLDSPEDVVQLALAYLHLDPNSHRPEDLKAAERLVMGIRRYIRVFDSSDYINQLAGGELCVAMAWSSDYSIAQQRAHKAGLDLHLAFTTPREGSNITYNALLIPKGAPHIHAAHLFINFILDPHVIAQITNDIHYGNDNLAARPFVNPEILADPAIYPSAELRARLYLPAEVDPQYQRLRTRTWTRIRTGF